MKYLIFMLFPLFLYSAPDAKLKISKNADQRTKISIVDASTGTAIHKKLHKIFVADLKISGHFRPDKKYYRANYDNTVPSAIHRSKEYILKYSFSPSNNGAVLLIKLLKTAKSKVVLEKKYAIPSSTKYPFAVHKAVTDLNSALGYKSIAWINRYIIFAKYTDKKQSEILLSDYTFNYTKTIVKGGLNLFPHWADSKQRGFYYTSYETGVPTIFYLNIYSGKRKKIMSSTGMIICSDVSKDGNKILLTMAPNMQPDIYEFDIRSRTLTRLTTYSGIDVNGKYSNSDENSITFVSDRIGRPNIYTKPIHSSIARQVIFHGTKNNSCDTYDGKIVYSSKEGANRFNIYLANNTGGKVRPLTSMGINQFPRFGPGGNTVLYIKRNRGINYIGYIGLQTNQTMLFSLGNNKIQSIDW